MPNVQRSLDNPPEILANNMLATAHVLEAARRYGVRRVALASSAGLYAADASRRTPRTCRARRPSLRGGQAPR